ncbi:nucleoside hydrolase [Candidatus Woesearchaeota archaeon]|nr:MAG: nucleoside hydrolase [Candidatus Woesearchaeota archaeon]
MKYIIDTDPGYDDAMAIMLAVKAGLDVIALTTVCGNSTINNITNNANHVLKLLDKSNIPIFSGASKPMKNELTEAVVHGENGFGGVNVNETLELSNNAVEKILFLIEENEEISLIALGPLTNIANAILKNPKTMSKLKELIIMGGAVKVPGNQSKVAEFNIFTDPEAAKIVFDSDIKKTLIPLDVCNKIQLKIEDFDQIKGELKEFLKLIASSYIHFLEKDEGVKSAIMYDPVAVYYCINPDSCKSEDLNLFVETKDSLNRGMTNIK